MKNELPGRADLPPRVLASDLCGKDYLPEDHWLSREEIMAQQASDQREDDKFWTWWEDQQLHYGWEGD